MTLRDLGFGTQRMGILDELEAEQRREKPPVAWANAEDKLEEWLGLVPEGTMKPRPRKKPDPTDMVISVTLCKDATDIYRPENFKNAIEYARALKFYARKIPKGHYAGYIIQITLGDVIHRRRIGEPVKNRAEAFASPEFVVALTKAIPAIQGHKS